ncbi:MAG: AAC(3) family N-acetyltransferase [Crocinitomicaceae bacterium]|nr:AAC(3) family N-acetyltransferase [Crocinitomicaceae bacterium]
MSLKDVARNLTPEFLLEWNRRRKKRARNKALNDMSERGQSISQRDLEEDFMKAGLKKGDHVLVHSSLSKIGHLTDGPKTFVDALFSVIGDEGTLLMPTSPNAVFQFDYIQKNKVFDVLNTPSKTGKITEYFRTLPGVKRSWHPTEPVSAKGALADYFIGEHFGQLTPYNEKSPFRKLSEKGGKILYVGVTLANAGTNLHTLEDAVDFKFPVYAHEIFDVIVIGDDGKKYAVKTKVHNPVYSKKRKCDELIPLFMKEGAITQTKIGDAATLVCDAARFFSVMKENYLNSGVTMYTPAGS